MNKHEFKVTILKITTKSYSPDTNQLFDYFLYKIFDKGFTPKQLTDLSILLKLMTREIAIEFDNNYSDHIKCSPEIFGISSLTGKIIKIDKSKIKSYKTFGAFRSLEEAAYAKAIMKPILKVIFNE